MENLKTAVWIAHSLFERGKASGSSANMSFKEKDLIYITGSGTCFGTLKEEDFSVLSLDFRAKAQQRISAAPNDV